MTTTDAIRTEYEFRALSTDNTDMRSTNPPVDAKITVTHEQPIDRSAYQYRQMDRVVLRISITGQPVIRLEVDRRDAAFLGATIIDADRIGSMPR